MLFFTCSHSFCAFFFTCFSSVLFLNIYLLHIHLCVASVLIKIKIETYYFISSTVLISNFLGPNNSQTIVVLLLIVVLPLSLSLPTSATVISMLDHHFILYMIQNTLIRINIHVAIEKDIPKPTKQSTIFHFTVILSLVIRTCSRCQFFSLPCVVGTSVGQNEGNTPLTHVLSEGGDKSVWWASFWQLQPSLLYILYLKKLNV